MNKHIVFVVIFSWLLSASFVDADNLTARLYQVDPLKKVLKETSYFRDEIDTIRIVKGETGSVQIVIKGLADISDMRATVGNISCGDNIISGAQAAWIGYVGVDRSCYPPSYNIIRAASHYFPDPILPDSAFSIETGEVQPLWISIPTNKLTVPGLYKGVVNITGIVNNVRQLWKKDFFVRVYNITLEKSPLLITNWSSHFNPKALSYLNNDEDVQAYSPLYWKLIEMHAKIMAEHRQNVHRIFPVWHTLYTYNQGKYTFNFERFDKEVNIFDKIGALERIEGGHLAWRSSEDWNSQYYVEVPLPDNEETRKLIPGVNPMKVENGIRFVRLPIQDKRTKNFLKQFLPALKQHLIEKGWLDRYMQHIGDEPIVQNAKSYCAISKYVKECFPGVKIFDAVWTSKELKGAVDIWVPLLSVLNRDYKFYQERQKEGEEVWFYTCVVPQGNYANRFIELPLIETRLLHWINYKYNLPGYLHWGLNFWQKDQLHTNADRDSGKLPAGDNCIVYPGYRKLYTSIRFETMRDGIDDYTLLKMLEKKNPEKAKEFASDLIIRFDKYDESVSYFRKVRKNLLETLSEYYK